MSIKSQTLSTFFVRNFPDWNYIKLYAHKVNIYNVIFYFMVVINFSKLIYLIEALVLLNSSCSLPKCLNVGVNAAKKKPSFNLRA